MTKERLVLEQLEKLGKSGKYLEAIRAYLRSDGRLRDDRTLNSVTAIKLQLQYAMALQHAGFFGLAQENYRRASAGARALLARRPKSHAVASLIYTARAHEAVLLERFCQYREALQLLDDIGTPQGQIDAHLARATLPSWVDITRMKCCLALKNFREARRVATRCLGGDWNQALWAAVIIGILDLLAAGSARGASRRAQQSILRTIEQMGRVDRPGMPWLALLAGEMLRRRFLEFAHSILEFGQVEASRLGKFFVIGAASEQLYYIHRARRNRTQAALFLKRAMNAFARCNVLLLPPFRQRIFRAGCFLWGSDEALNAFMQSGNLVPARSSVIFSKMCAERAHQRATAGAVTKPWQIFEEFVRDWAPLRYPGRLRYTEGGRESADAILVHRGKGIVIQAKHVRRPKEHIPVNLYLRNIAEAFGIGKIERYVLVISTSEPGGWRDSFWDVQATIRVKNLIPDPTISVEVVLEPELQTDVLLDLNLYDRYFRGIDL